MKFLIILAFKNLTRYKRRTLITCSAIAFGLMLFLLFDSLIIGMQKESERNLRDYETGYLRLYANDYYAQRLSRPLDIAIEQPDVLVQTLADAGYRASKRVVFLADMILSSSDFGEDGNMNVEVTAVDFPQDFKVFSFKNTLMEGRFPSPNANEVVIGSWFAQDIGAKVGYTISLVTRGNGGFYQVMDLQIVGILNCPNPNVNRSLLMMDYRTADYYLALDGSATEIDVALSSLADLEHAAKQIQLLAPDCTLMTWKELASDYFAFAAADEGSADLMLVIVFIITVVGISNTMLMAVQERFRELGMMRALGMRDGSLYLAFLLEAGGIGLIGSVAGMLLASFFNVFLVTYGLDFSFLMRSMDMGYRVSGIMKGVWSFKSYLLTLLTGMFLPMLIAYFPTRRALRLNIPDCLHHQ
ncbi:MAG: ABC transporter permease [Sphaerochaeta sp.]|uniref:ABC transporter permease n=1 Tax=Sphaerochaeta sp. TaxID=1972642 RepID=UPI002FC730D4